VGEGHPDDARRPLLNGEDVIGVLHVGRRDHHRFTDNDAELLQVAAERVADATQSATARHRVRRRLCSAGHPPPVLAVAGHEAQFVDVAPGPPLGALPHIARSARSVEVPEGSTLVLYTDGLIEDRSQPIDDGLHKLRSAVRADDPAIVCQTVMHELVGNRPPTDDIAVLAMRRAPSRTGM
jgi:hypothetical protein